MALVLETTIGDLTIDLFTDTRPICCQNFLKLCRMKYYNFSLFHTVQSNFIAQTGDPTGTGKGGESIFSFIKGPDARYILGEKLPKMKHYKPGLVSMVNCGNHLIGSQFFITLGADLDSLNEHIIFGEITEGYEVLLKLNETICDLENRPYKDIRISHTVILEDPFDEIEGLIFPAESPAPTEEVLKTDRIAADEEIEDLSKFSRAQIHEIKAEQEAKAQATILEIVGDIPDVECAPPENVLFVCKLNPVTTDEDLQIIFSRFGKINSCEVIRDKDSGDSLQYAFIEFDNQKSCEDAYMKMDNVLIDDRRIHVDFSQSVAKLKWRGKGRGVVHVKDEDTPRNNDKQSRRHNEDRRHPRDEIRRYQSTRKRSRDRQRSRSLSKHRERRQGTCRKRSRSRQRRSRSRSADRARSYRRHDSGRSRGSNDRNRDYRDRDRHKHSRR